MHKFQKIIFCLSILLLGISTIVVSQDKPPTLPSEILQWSLEKAEEMLENEEIPTSQLNQTRMDLIRKAIVSVNPQELSRIELIKYCELLTRIGRDDETKEFYAQMQEGTDLAAQIAVAKLAQFSAYEKDVETAEALIRHYYETFQPNPEFSENLSGAISSLSSQYWRNGNADAGAQLILDELNWLSGDFPYRSYILAVVQWAIIVDANRKEELEQLLKSKIAALNESAQRVENGPNGKKEAGRFKSMTGMLQRTLTQVELINNPAPPLTFVAALNGSIQNLDALKGKVVLLDFWGTVCEPCIRAFPHMAKIYQEFNDQDFEILGVTSFWTSISYPQFEAKDMTPEEEIKAVKDFLDYYKMTWPIVFLEESVNGLKSYGISGIPTFALLDKKGVIRLIRLGTSTSNAEELRELIRKLLAE